MPQRKSFVTNAGMTATSHCGLCKHDGNLSSTPPRRRILTERNDLAGYSPSPVSKEEMVPLPKIGFGDKGVEIENIGSESETGSRVHGVLDSNDLRRGSEGIGNWQIPFLPPPSSSPRVISPSDVGSAVRSPYDPETNYLSPRPQFLCYRPNPRVRKFLRSEEVGLNDVGDGFRINRRVSYGNRVENSREAQSLEAQSFRLRKNYEEETCICRAEKKDNTFGSVDLQPRSKNHESSSTSIHRIFLLFVLATVACICTAMMVSSTHFVAFNSVLNWSLEKLKPLPIHISEDHQYKKSRDFLTELVNPSINQGVGFDDAMSEQEENSEAAEANDNVEILVSKGLAEEEDNLSAVKDTEVSEDIIEDDGIGKQAMVKSREGFTSEANKEESPDDYVVQDIEEAADEEHKSTFKDISSAPEATDYQEVETRPDFASETQPVSFSNTHSEAGRYVPDSYQLASDRPEIKLRAFRIFLAISALGAILISRYTKQKRPRSTIERSIADNATSNSMNRSNETCGPDGISAKGSVLRSCSSSGPYGTKKGEQGRRKRGSILSSAISYGSLTIYEKLPPRKGCREEGGALTPVRRSSRIRNRFASSG